MVAVLRCGNRPKTEALSHKHTPAHTPRGGTTMSDPRQFEHENLSPNSYSDNRSSLGDTSVWIAVIAAVLIVFGAVTYFGGNSQEPNATGTTSGHTARPPESNAS